MILDCKIKKRIFLWKHTFHSYFILGEKISHRVIVPTGTRIKLFQEMILRIAFYYNIVWH